MRSISFVFVVCLLLALVSCGGKNEAQLASAENVFKTVTVELPENYQVISDTFIELDGRIGVVCRDGYNPEMDFDTVLYTVDENGENPETTVLPTFRDNTHVASYTPLEGGGCVIMDRKYTEPPYNMLYMLDSNMEMVNTVDLSQFDDRAYKPQMAVGGNGNIYLSVEGRAIVLSAEGRLCYSKTYSGWLDSIRTMDDGRVTIQFLDMSNATTKLQYFDDVNMGFGEAVKSPQRLNASAYTVYPGGDGYDMYLTNELGLFGYTIEGAVETELCNWLNSDIIANEVNMLHIYSPDKFAMHSHRMIGYDNETLTVCTRVPESEVTPKYLITLQTNRTGYDIQRAVVMFNKQNENYRVVVKDYAQYNTADDAFVALSQLDKEIISGEYIPDIFTVSSDNFGKYADLGLYCDLYEFLDSDPEFTRDLLVPCVMGPLETNGHLYQLPRSFQVLTMYTSPKFPISKADWTLDAMLDYADSADFPIFNGYNRSQFVNYFFDYGMGNFIDTENVTCNFESDTVKRLVELFADYGEYWYEGVNGDDRDALREENLERVKNGEMASYTNINRIESLLAIYNAFGGQAPKIIGFPTENGGVNYIDAYGSYAISAKSPVKEGAWEFVKFVVSEAYLDEDPLISAIHRYGYSSLRDRFEEQVENDVNMVYFYENARGNTAINVTDAHNAQRLDPEIYTIIEFPEELAEMFKDLAYTTTEPRVRYSEALDIIKEELDYVFEGVKSVDEVLGLIQNRVSILISERS